MNWPMPSGSSSVLCCLGRSEGGSGWMTGWSSMESPGSSGRARPGGTYPSGRDPGPRCTLASADGPGTAPSSGCSGKPRRGRMRPVRSTGWYRSTPPSSEPTSIRPGPEKKAPKPGARPLQRWTDQQDSPGLRCCRPTARLRSHRQEHQRLHPVHRRDGGDTGAPRRSWPPPRTARSCPGRQGLQQATGGDHGQQGAGTA